MIICYYTELNKLWSDHEFEAKLQQLPEQLIKETLRKKHRRDQQLSVAGKLLLQELLKEYGLADKLTLDKLLYNIYHRPYFVAEFDFNIAHAGNIAICCGTTDGKAGIDIEQINQINTDDYNDYFTLNEWEYINSDADRLGKFYYYWTRKEAALKAIGTGFHTALNTIDVSGESLMYHNVTYHFQTHDVDSHYKCHIATTTMHLNMEISKITI